MNSWKSKSYSFDICFCSAACKNIDCHRNKKSEHYHKMLKQCFDGIHSECDFGVECNDRR